MARTRNPRIGTALKKDGLVGRAFALYAEGRRSDFSIDSADGKAVFLELARFSPSRRNGHVVVREVAAPEAHIPIPGSLRSRQRPQPG